MIYLICLGTSNEVYNSKTNLEADIFGFVL